MRRRVLLAAVAAGIGSTSGCLADSGANPSTDGAVSPPPDSESPTATATETSTPTPPNTPTETAPATPAPCSGRTPSPTPPANSGAMFDPDVASTYRRIELGSRDGVDDAYQPHHVRVWNALDDARQVALAIDDTLAAASILDDTFTVPGDAALEVTLLEPSRYLLTVATPAENSCHRLSVPCDLFDCNWSSTTVAIFEDGDLRSLVFSETAGCEHYDC